MADPIYPLRLPEATKARWLAAAREAGVSLAAFVRETVEARLNGREPNDRVAGSAGDVPVRAVASAPPSPTGSRPSSPAGDLADFKGPRFK